MMIAAVNGPIPWISVTIESSSGEWQRCRLNPRSNRRLDFALHVAAIARLRHPGVQRACYGCSTWAVSGRVRFSNISA